MVSKLLAGLMTLALGLPACQTLGEEPEPKSLPSPKAPPKDWQVYEVEGFTIALPPDWTFIGDKSDESVAELGEDFVAGHRAKPWIVVVRFYEGRQGLRTYAEGLRDSLDQQGDYPVDSFRYFLTPVGEVAEMFARTHHVYIFETETGFYHLDFVTDGESDPTFVRVAEYFTPK